MLSIEELLGRLDGVAQTGSPRRGRPDGVAQTGSPRRGRPDGVAQTGSPRRGRPDGVAQTGAILGQPTRSLTENRLPYCGGSKLV